MKFEKSLLSEYNPEETVHLVDGEQVQGWVIKVIDNDKTKEHYAAILIDEEEPAYLDLESVITSTLTRKSNKMKDILECYDYIELTAVEGPPEQFSFTYKNPAGMISIGDVPWDIIDDGFLEIIEVKQRTGLCSKCNQEIYTKEVKRLKPNLLDDFASKLAVISSANGLKMNQLRNFYDEVKATKGRIERKTDLSIEGQFEIEKPRIKLLLARAANAFAKNNIPKVFHEFIRKSVEIVTHDDAKFEDFEAFTLTFEAVTGFFKEKK